MKNRFIIFTQPKEAVYIDIELLVYSMEDNAKDAFETMEEVNTSTKDVDIKCLDIKNGKFINMLDAYLYGYK